MHFNYTKYILIVFPAAILCGRASFAQDTITNSAIDKVLSVVETVTGNGNFIDNLSPDSNIALPFGIRKQIGAVRYIVAIDSCKFKPAGAYFNAYAAIDFPGTTKKLAFEAANIKFNPKGVVGGNQARLLLVSEHTIRINNLVSLKLKKDGSNWIEWDCNGYKAINLTGYFVFNKAKLVPDSTQTKDTVVTASFHIYTTDLHDFVTQVSITPFAIRDLKNWTFKATDASVDMSELINPPGMIFPPGYSNPNMLTPQMWSGFYLKSIKIKLPSEISKVGKRTEITASNLLIDNMGVTGLFQINNFLTLDEGSMSGWDYSIDELGVGFLCNKLNSGHLKGKVNIPVMDSSQSLVYTADVYHNPTSKEADYHFVINPANNIKFNVFSAQVNLSNTSVITVEKSKGLFKPTAVLNGYMSFNHKNFNSNGGQLLFQDLTFVTHGPYYVTKGIFTLHNIGNQTKTANYPASVNDISFGFNTGAPIMTFSVSINLSDNANSGLSVGTAVSLKGKIEAKPINYKDEIAVSYTKTKWKFDKIVINGFSLGVTTSVFTLTGNVLFLDNDPMYGDGFFGHILFSIDKVLPTPASVTARFGAVSTYRYYYVDAAIPTNIPLGSSPITLTKIMGGLYYHMKPLNASQTELINASKAQPVNPANALTYSPDINTHLGFKAGVSFKYTPNEKSANGDVMLEVAFTQSGGLSFVKLDGNIYFMSEPHEQNKSSVTGSVAIQYDVPKKAFDADAAIKVNAHGGKLTGNGFAKVHIDPAIWYVCIGKPSAQNTVNLLNLVNAQTYFMAGNSIEPALAPPPQVASILSQSALAANRNETQLQGGSGFCAGASLSASINEEFGFSFFTVYGNYNFGLGFDMMMIDYGPNGYCSGNSNEKIGLNGMLATGGMYLYMQGSVGVKGDIHFLPECNCKRRLCACSDFNFKVFELGVAAIVTGKLPKPLYFSGQFGCNYEILGLVKGNFNFDYDYG
ncbi:MAG: hypothetical protein EPN85_09530, partial [Bacteroidetes bacterium]